MNPSTALGRFRIIAFIEGLSYIVLLAIAMPLKYFADMPTAVTISGAIHGGLFLAYMLLLAWVAIQDKWPGSEIGIALVVSIVPFATFFADRRWARMHNAGDMGPSANK